MTTTANTGATHIVEGGEQQATAANDAFNLLDAVIQGNVKDSAPSTTPPGGPATGDRYIVPGSATGDWASQDDDITWYDGSAWLFITPAEGWLVFDQLNNKFVYFDGTNWTDFQAADITAITDNSGGTSSRTIASIGASYSQSEVANAVASLADAINDLRTNLRAAGLMA